MNKKITLVASLVFGLLITAPGLAAHFETADLMDVKNAVVEDGDTFGKGRVLVVFDIDNTILATNQNLGSDQWFSWQSSLIKSGDLENAVTSDFGKLLGIQEKLYALSGTRQTQKDAAMIVKSLQKRGFPVIALTARSSEYRDSTMRELKRHGFTFKSSGIGKNAGFPGRYKPYSLNNLPEAGILKLEAELWGLKEARDVTYLEGVFMASGQHKGAMLRTLINKTKGRFDSIIFIDDKAKNIKNMTNGFKDTPVQLTTVRYTKEDSAVLEFQKSDKALVIKHWKQLSEVLFTVFK